MTAKDSKRALTRKIGTRLRELREYRGLSQHELSRRTGVAQNLISEYEAGSARMHAALFARLARALDGNADELLGLQEITRRTPPPKVLSRKVLRRAELIEDLHPFIQKHILRTIDLLLKAADLEKKP